MCWAALFRPCRVFRPPDLKIDLLTERIARGGVKEVILAISTSVEGETTLFYLMNRLRQFPELKVTSIARGGSASATNWNMSTS